MNKIYVVERRRYLGDKMITEDSDCFVSFSLERTEKWIKDKKIKKHEYKSNKKKWEERAGYAGQNFRQN